MSTYQATVVPQQNTQVEFTHEQTVRNDFVGVRNAVVTTGTTGETAPAAVKLGTRFPSRTLFVNPPPAVARIETGEPRNVTLNVSQATFTANPPESGEVEDGWPTSASEQVGADEEVANYTTKPLVYTPQYRSYDGGPDNVTLELSHALSQYAGGETVNLTEAPLLARGDRVTLFLVKGNLSESGVESVTLEPTAVSSVSQRVRVSNFTVTVPTSLTAAQFERLTNETQLSNPENVSFSDNGSRVDVTFEDNRSLGVGVVSFGRHEASRTAAAVELTSVEASVTAGESARVVVRVRDQYGNALPGATVTANASAFDGAVQQTDSTGRTAFEFNTSGLSDLVEVNVTVNESVASATGMGPFDQSVAENATANVTVSSPSDGPTEDQTGAWPLEWINPDPNSADGEGPSQDSSLSFNDCNNKSCTVNMGGTTADLNLSVTTEGETSGASVSYAVNNSTVATTNTGSSFTGTTNSEGYGNLSLTPQNNGTVEVAASSGGSTVTYNVVFEDVDVTPSGEQVEKRGSASASGDSGKAQFVINNTGNEAVDLTGIALVNSTADNNLTIKPQSNSQGNSQGNGQGSATFRNINKSEKLYFEEINESNGKNTLNSPDQIGARESYEYEIKTVRDSEGEKVEFSDTTITVTIRLYFADGSTTKIELEYDNG